MDALLRRECGALQVGLGSELLGHGRSLRVYGEIGQNRVLAGGGRFLPNIEEKSLAIHRESHWTNLLVRDWCLLLIGQLNACAHVCSQVCFAAYQQNACAGAEILNLSFPLQTDEAIVRGLL